MFTVEVNEALEWFGAVEADKQADRSMEKAMRRYLSLTRYTALEAARRYRVNLKWAMDRWLRMPAAAAMQALHDKEMAKVKESIRSRVTARMFAAATRWPIR